jgi:hypothetical protein
MQTRAMSLLLDGASTYTPPVLCILFGVGMLVVAIVGGFRAKDYEIPALQPWARWLSGICGVALLVFGLKLAVLPTEPKQPIPSIIVDSRGAPKADESHSKADESHLGPLKCATADSLKSGASTSETTVVFENQTAAKVNLLWIDQQGERRQWATLSPKNMNSDDHVKLKTYEGHVWLVQNEQGACLEAFIALPQDTIAVISSSDF